MAKQKNEAPGSEEAKAPTGETETAETQDTPTTEESGAAAPETGDTDRYIRLMAEFDNYKKRSVRERENIYADVRVDTVTRFLPVYDNLQRALSAETADEAYKKGVEMTFNQLLDVFRKLGVEEIESVGQPFDPTLHNAVMHVQDEESGENMVVEEFQKGFKLGEKVIRFSMVKVAN
ncbi:MAG: nucleotide exchange factor GrpE [Oscillospiraceae bacterium]|nr:nucleotide exchange factor GrpE [Oscillospiraceae bacterium]MCC8156854.1 nucleotide exchange factor GrpE [Oscillospiraceae bacterium]